MLQAHISRAKKMTFKATTQQVELFRSTLLNKCANLFDRDGGWNIYSQGVTDDQEASLWEALESSCAHFDNDVDTLQLKNNFYGAIQAAMYAYGAVSNGNVKKAHKVLRACIDHLTGQYSSPCMLDNFVEEGGLS